jgi:hypothetical protein
MRRKEGSEARDEGKEEGTWLGFVPLNALASMEQPGNGCIERGRERNKGKRERASVKTGGGQ